MTINCKCDLCTKQVDASYELVDLLDSYKTKDIQHLCSDCAKDANDMLFKLRALTQKWCSRKMRVWLRVKKQFKST